MLTSSKTKARGEGIKSKTNLVYNVSYGYVSKWFAQKSKGLQL